MRAIKIFPAVFIIGFFTAMSAYATIQKVDIADCETTTTDINVNTRVMSATKEEGGYEVMINYSNSGHESWNVTIGVDNCEVKTGGMYLPEISSLPAGANTSQIYHCSTSFNPKRPLLIIWAREIGAAEDSRAIRTCNRTK